MQRWPRPTDHTDDDRYARLALECPHPRTKRLAGPRSAPSAIRPRSQTEEATGTITRGHDVQRNRDMGPCLAMGRSPHASAQVRPGRTAGRTPAITGPTSLRSSIQPALLDP